MALINQRWLYPSHAMVTAFTLPITILLGWMVMVFVAQVEVQVHVDIHGEEIVVISGCISWVLLLMLR